VQKRRRPKLHVFKFGRARTLKNAKCYRPSTLILYEQKEEEKTKKIFLKKL
jgi:hypothetical protein